MLKTLTNNMADKLKKARVTGARMMKNNTPTFREELTSLINRHSKENGSNTPDFILVNFLLLSLAALDNAVQSRDEWFGINPWDKVAPISKRVKIKGYSGTVIPGVASHAGHGKKVKVRPERRNPTTDIVRAAMKATAKDVQSPKVVRDGTVKLKENKDLVKLGKEAVKYSTAKVHIPSDEKPIITAKDQEEFKDYCSKDPKLKKWKLGDQYRIEFKHKVGGYPKFEAKIVRPINGETNFDQPGLSHGFIHFLIDGKPIHCGIKWFLENAVKL